MKHKHADLIKAWADGEVIQYYGETSKDWFDCTNNNPSWDSTTQYRVKPIPKEPVVELWYVHNNRFNYAPKNSFLPYNLRLTFDGADSDKLLSAEVVKNDN